MKYTRPFLYNITFLSWQWAYNDSNGCFRMRRRYENQQQSNEHIYTCQLSEMESRSEQVQIANSEASDAIASPNEYERLNMYTSPHCNSEMYQQLNIANA
jgi:hypothetical protein